MRRLNIKLVVGLVVGCLLLSVGVYLLHGFQVDRNADDLLKQAQRAMEGDKPDRNEAVKRYAQYLQFRDNAEIYEKLSEISDHVVHSTGASQVEKRRAYEAMEEAVRRHPELVESRKRFLNLMMEWHTWDRALEHAKYLQSELTAQGKSDVDIDYKVAQCEMFLKMEAEARKHLAAIIGFNEATMEFNEKPGTGPNKVEAYISLAGLLSNRAADRKAVEKVLDQLVAVNNTAAAYVQRGHYHLYTGKPDASDEDYNKAYEVDPNDAEAILVKAQVLAHKNKLEESLKIIEDGVQKHPKNESMYRALAHLQMQNRQYEQALENLNKGIEIAEDDLLLLVDKAEFLLNMAAAAADAAERDSALDRAKPVIAELRKLKVNEALLQDFEGRQLLAKKQWQQAVKILSKSEPLLARDPERGMMATLRLAQCYEELNQTDRALEAYLRVLNRDKDNIPSLVGAGKAYEKQGKAAEATKYLERADELLAKRDMKVVQLRGVILYQRINEQLRKPKADRDWKAVELIADDLSKDSSYTPLQRELLQADVLLYKGEYAEASKRLQPLLKQNPKELALYLRYYELLQRQASETSEADAKAALLKRSANVLTVAQKEIGDTPGLRLARMSHAQRQPEADKVKQQLAELEKGLDAFSENDQVNLWNELGTAYYRLRDYDNVERCWKKVAEMRPDDSKLAQTRFDVAREFGDEAGLAARLEEIKERFGDDSALYSYAKASQIVSEVRSGKKEKSALKDARLAADDARRQRAEWYELSRIEGEIEELDGNLDVAIENYRTALERGPYHPGIAERIVKLLYVQGKFDEAAQILRTTGSALKGEMIDKIRVVTQVKSGDEEQAIAQAEAVVEKNPDDVNNQIWLAALYNHASRTADAEKVYRKVVELDPKTPRHWLLLVFHLANDKQMAEAEAALDDAKEHLAADDVPLTMAQGYEMLAQGSQAERAYLEALELHPNDIPVLRHAATFFLRTQRDQIASDYLDRILKKDVPAGDKDADNVRWARRTKALILAAKGDYKNFAAAVKLVDQNADPNGNLNAEDLLLKINVLAKRGDRTSRNQAITLLTKLKEKRQLSASEQYNLARLYDLGGNWTEARREMLEVVSRSGNTENVDHLAAYATMLIRHDEVQDAQTWYNKLIQLAPKSPQAIELRARLLAKTGKAPQAVALLEQYVPENITAAQMGNLATVANLFKDMEQYEAAERMLRRKYQLEPRTVMELASFLGEHGDIDEAFDLLETARRSTQLGDIVRAGIQILRQRQTEVEEKHYAKVSEWINTGLQDDPNSDDLQLHHAELLDVAGKYKEAADRYRQYIARTDINEQRRAISKNNLSFVLVVAPQKPTDADEALRLVNEAINVFGPTSDMLDTRAMAYYAKGDYTKAIADLKAALEDGATAVKYFHLALVQRKNEDKGAAAVSLKKAKEMKLQPGQLAKAERPWLKQLASDLDVQ
jgi:cellulose synthase operon protein C